jgi:CubicO group peptidase (beta-lactamase class C family)
MELTDHEKLSSVTIKRSDSPFHFIQPKNSRIYKPVERMADSILENSSTAAFLIIRNDTILYEKYFSGFNETSLLPSNSMAKSFTGSLVSIAISEGAIPSDQLPVTHFLPELLKSDPRFKKITIRHLIDMRSGLDFKEGSYDLKDDAIRLGLRPNIEKHLLKAKIAEPPGRFRYQSINTQLLGLIVERATKTKLQDYFQKKLWEPMGTEQVATWNTDSKKRKFVLAAAGLNATARDFVKLARLYLNNGVQNGKQIIDREWIRNVADKDTMEAYGGYKNQWWNRRVNSQRTGSYCAIGFLNQVMYVNPQKNLVILRLGKRWTGANRCVPSIYALGELL